MSAANAPWLSIVGIGEDGPTALPPAARVLVDTAEVLFGGARHLAMLPDHPAERREWQFPLEQSIGEIAARRGQRVTALASGDPMSYGIGVTLGRHFTPDEMLVVPAPGAFSLAAARLGWPLADCRCLTLHGRPLALLAAHLAPGVRLLILSADGDTPAAVARALSDAGYGPSELVVLEHMGGAAEARREATAEHWPATRAADLNTLAVTCRTGSGAAARPRTPGLPDDAYAHDGQLTKRVVRAAALAALAPLPGQHLWDLGAGCGSIGIEWLRAAQNEQGRGASAVAVERAPARCRLIAQNAAALGTPYLNIVEATIDDAIAGLAPPDAVFIGGGVDTEGLIALAWQALATGGRLVANAVTTGAEARLLEAHAHYGGALTRIAVSHAAPIGERTAWRAAIPVTQWSATKP